MPWQSVRILVDSKQAEPLSDALMEMVVEGIQSNIPLHQDLMNDAAFIAGGTSIHYLEHKLAGEKA